MKRWAYRRALVALSVAGFAAILSGCPDAGKPVNSGPGKSGPRQALVVLVVDDPDLGKAAAQAWRGRTEEDLTVRDISLAEVTQAGRLPGDAIMFPSGLIGQLAERGLISPLEPEVLEDAEFGYREIFDQIRLGETRWGGRTVAAPLGSPQFLLVYRPDIFEKLGLEPPADWSDYERAAQRLAEAPVGESPWRGTLEPLGEGWAGQLLLARAASYAMHREQVSPLFSFDKFAPLIDQPPFVRALEELVAAAKAGGYASERLSPAEVYAFLREGRAAMGITWAVNEPAAREERQRDVALRFALLPGSAQAYRFATRGWEPRGAEDERHVPLRAVAGRMAAVCASSSDPRRAAGFVVWLAGREVSQQVGPHSGATTLFRQSQVAASGRWTGSLSPDASRQYAETLAECLNLPRGFGLTLPGRMEYLAALDQAVHEALEGKPAAEALAEAAKQWAAITEKLGVEAQRRASGHSLGRGE